MHNSAYRSLAAWCACALVLLWGGAAGAGELRTDRYTDPVFGGSVHVVEAGDRSRPSVVLVHGVGELASDIWQELIPALARDYHVLAFDLPGFGRSDKGNRLYSPERYGELLHALTRARVGKPFMLVGHSLGGNIALHYAASHPQDVERLVLIDVAGVLHRISYSQTMAHAGIEALPALVPGQGAVLRGVAANLLATVLRNNELLEAGEWLVLTDARWRERILRGDPQTIAAYAMIMTDYSDLIREVQAPTLIVWGERDTVAPLRTAKVLATHIPRAGLVTFEASGHVPMTDEPRRFHALLGEFLAAAPAERDALLTRHRFPIEHGAPRAGAQPAVCRGAQGQVFEGDYTRIELDGCRDAVLRNLRAREVVIRNSSATLENCALTSELTALQVEDARVEVTACRIEGEVAAAFARSRLDFAGVKLVGRRHALHNLAAPSATPAADGHGAHVVFSTSRMRSGAGGERWLHGPVELRPGTGL